MKNNLPIIAGVLVVVGVIIFARQYTMSQSVTLRTQEKNAQTTSSQDVSGSPASSTNEAVSMVSGITLTISTPSNNTTVSGNSLTVKGKTVAGAEVFVNDSETKADAGGNFSVILTLEDGENYILVVANDAVGNYSEKELNITYTP